MPAWLRTHTISKAIVLGATAAVPLLIWPGASSPFETPRLVLLGAALVLHAALAAIRRDPSPALPSVLIHLATAWLLVIGVSAAFASYVSSYALIVWTLPIAWALAIVRDGLSPAALTMALVIASTSVSACAVLQWIGWDPLQVFGWHPVGSYGPRMKVYATLGNPNFAGAYLAGMLPLSMAWRTDRNPPASAWAALPALHAAAIVATGSRAAWLGAVIALMVFGVGRRTDRRRWMAATALLAVITTGVLLAPTRAMGETLGGRLHIWTTAAAHALEHPFIGSGPGSFALLYPRWEAGQLARGVDEADRIYVAAQRHAHNDYLEILVELGVPGLVSIVALIGGAVAWSLRGAQGSMQDLRAAAAAGMAALGAIALVDFPFQRPVESVTWWTLLALAVSARRRRSEAGLTG